ncbi:MAG: 1-deoxy-D-xylulose-5-phosphate reductoisomerase [Thiotrichales bacterium]|nr:1-deoxy-D-xylulose-5-phosphate reductoisomerase [Thiotrichales bacterium]
MKRLTVCGSTGSIGVSTLDVVSRNRSRYEIFALTAHSSVDRLAAQCRQWRPQFAVMSDDSAAVRLAAMLSSEEPKTEVLAGASGLQHVAAHPEVDYVMAAIVGGAGLVPTLAAARVGKRVLLANKEALVMSGRLFMDAVREAGADLLPIDSEHNAIYQCMPGADAHGPGRGVRRILLTGSGGPFRARSPESLHDVTPDEACAHPNWSMGRKISVDSATMMNKGLEVIEACWLFDTGPDAVEVVVHPQSVIHSMVDYEDGSVLAQLGNPDMRTPIAHALAWPERMESGVAPLDLVKTARLDFEAPDFGRFPCLRLGFEAVRAGGSAPAALNAANEVAVDAFLNQRLRFTAIARVVEETMLACAADEPRTLDDVLDLDGAARARAAEFVAAASSRS